MRKIIVLLFVLTMSASTQAQTLTIEPITDLQYCIGDTMTVSYTSIGSFDTNNFFVLQLSDSNGSFGTFANFGHSTTLTGSFRLPLLYQESHLRIRLASTTPYLYSDDNGSDISVLPLPSPSITLHRQATGTTYGSGAFIGFADEQFTLTDATNEPAGSTYLWTFDSTSGLSPATGSSTQVTFSTSDAAHVTLSVTNANGCTATTSASYTLLSCSPEIPANAHIVTSSESTDDAGAAKVIWVKAGGELTGPTKWQTIFAEPGASVSLEGISGGFIYLKEGASFSYEGAGIGADNHLPIVVMTPGRQLVVDNMQYQIDTFYCSDVTFGTSQLSGGPNTQTIEVGTIPTQTYHVGDTVKVPYQSSGAFGSGNFFEAELSDANGSFNDFTITGQDTLLTGSIGVPIGAAGSHYRVRIISSDPYVASADNGSDISTNANATVSESAPNGIQITQISEHLLVQASETSVEVHLYTMLGTELLFQQGSGTLDVDLSSLPAGVYFAVIEAGNERVVKRIAVVH